MNKIEKAKLKKKIMQMNKRLNDNKDISVNEANKKENSQGDNSGGNVQNKLLNLQVKKLMMMEYERDKKLNFLEVIQKLKIPLEATGATPHKTTTMIRTIKARIFLFFIAQRLLYMFKLFRQPLIFNKFVKI